MAPESRRTVTFIPPVGGNTLAIPRHRYGKPMSWLLHSIISIPPRRRHTRVVRLQHSKVCLFYPAQVAVALVTQTATF